MKLTNLILVEKHRKELRNEKNLCISYDCFNESIFIRRERERERERERLSSPLKIYFGGLGTLTSAQNIGYNQDAPGIESSLIGLYKSFGIEFGGYYSTSKKVKTNQGYCVGWHLNGLVQLKGKLFLVSGLNYNYYTAVKWEKSAYQFFSGLKYGLPDDVISFSAKHYLQEYQTNTECSAFSIEVASVVGIFCHRLVVKFTRYNSGQVRKTGISGNIGIGFLFNLF